MSFCWILTTTDYYQFNMADSINSAPQWQLRDPPALIGSESPESSPERLPPRMDGVEGDSLPGSTQGDEAQDESSEGETTRQLAEQESLMAEQQMTKLRLSIPYDGVHALSDDIEALEAELAEWNSHEAERAAQMEAEEAKLQQCKERLRELRELVAYQGLQQENEGLKKRLEEFEQLQTVAFSSGQIRNLFDIIKQLKAERESLNEEADDLQQDLLRVVRLCRDNGIEPYPEEPQDG